MYSIKVLLQRWYRRIHILLSSPLVCSFLLSRVIYHLRRGSLHFHCQWLRVGFLNRIHRLKLASKSHLHSLMRLKRLMDNSPSRLGRGMRRNCSHKVRYLLNKCFIRVPLESIGRSKLLHPWLWQYYSKICFPLSKINTLYQLNQIYRTFFVYINVVVKLILLLVK